MARKEKNWWKFISVAIFIGLEIASLDLLSSSSTLQNIWINRASHRTMAALWGSGERVRNYFKLGEQNEYLTRENMELARRVAGLERSMELACIKAETPQRVHGFEYIPATIVKMSRNNQHNYIILDKGSEDGVEPECGIITASGVVGIVEAVDRHFSYGLTLTNVNIKVSARIGRNGAIGPMSWDGRSTNRAFIRELPMHYEASMGDTVRTSGYSTIYPPDIPLGLTGSSKIVNGSTRDLEVTLFQDFSSLRNVTIVKNLGLSEIHSLEKKEETDEK